jgi:1-acyl-sn-glycerol-3-phosphate acyltransferase
MFRSNEGAKPVSRKCTTGKMRDFKEGAFVLAKRLEVPVLPIVINGSKNAVPKNSLNFHGRTHVHVEILDAVNPEQFETTSVTELTFQIKEMIRCRVNEEQTDAVALTTE